MTWATRFKLVFGTILVTALALGATMLFNERQNRVQSTTATISDINYTVGTEYGGLVVNQFVKPGQHVTKGERIVQIDSLLLKRDIEAGLVSGTSASVTPSQLMVVRAGADGIVSQLHVEVGSDVAAGDVVATVGEEDSAYVEASFTLTVKELGRLEKGAAVSITLPDERTIAATLTDFSVQTADGDASVTAHVDAPALTTDAGDPLVQPGTPVIATVHLRDDGPFAGVSDAVKDFATRIGLR